MTRILNGTARLVTIWTLFAASAGTMMPAAHADSKRLKDAVVSNVYTVQHQAGCTNDITVDPRLQLAAQWHAEDLLNNRALDGGIGSDGSRPQDRAKTAGFGGPVAETVAINPALAINGVDIINQWFHDTTSLAVMTDCGNSQIGVWSLNSLDRSVVVAVFGKPT